MIQLHRLAVVIGGLLLTASAASAQGFWSIDARNHPELHWQTLETRHFEIHFHQGLEEIAKQAATVAETIYGPVTRQLRTEPRRRTSVVLTAQDEIENGFTLRTGQIFIWVNRNGTAGAAGRTDRWLSKAIAHEFQHVVTDEALRSWANPWDLLSVPAWFTEGVAEYFTEPWGLHRSDAEVRAMTLRNRLEELDPHDSGFAKVLYLAREYGDSTIVRIVKHRARLGIYSFSKAFRKATGRSLDAFEEDWRRTMNGHYYGALAAKEGIDEVGAAVRLPISSIMGLAWAPDSSRIAVVGAMDRGMRDSGLYLVAADGRTRREVDHGIIGHQLSWSPDAASLVYARYHRGSHGSLVWDLCRLDLKGKGAGGRAHRRWLTRNARAGDPSWSPDGREIVFLAHPGETTNLYLMDPDGGRIRPLSNFTGDVQLLSPTFSPDGEWIAFSIVDEKSDPDIAVIRRDGTGFRHVTRDSAYDTDPVWLQDGSRIGFTSDRAGTANLYSVAFHPTAGTAPEGAEAIAPMTDVGEGIWSAGRAPGSGAILALTLDSVDSARVVLVAGDRRAEPGALSQRPRFIDWVTHRPGIGLPPPAMVAPAEPAIEMSGPHPYRAWHDPRVTRWLVLPSLRGVGGFLVANDAMGRHVVAIAGGVTYRGEAAYQVSYLDATHLPLFDLSLYSRVRSGLRLYAGDLLTEELRGASAGMTFAYNRGDNLAADHTVRFSVDVFERTPRNLDRFRDGLLPVPVGGNQGIAGLEYRWLHRRPHRANAILPAQGMGVGLSYERSDREVYGDFTYARWSAEAFANHRIPAHGPVGFVRMKLDGVDGSPPAQEFVGVSGDDAFYLPPGSPLEALVAGYVRRYETARLRGWPHIWHGDRVLWGTAEIRFPLAGAARVPILGITPAGLSGAVFADFASVWDRTGRPVRDWRVTEGVEIKHEVRFGASTLVVASEGVGQPWSGWRRGRTDHAEKYFRLALVNPF